VLVLNKKVEKGKNKKSRPRYLGPMIVVNRTEGGSYRLAEVSGTVLNRKFAAFRLIPYHARSKNTVKVTEYVEKEDLED
jgi:hypothetical protein